MSAQLNRTPLNAEHRRLGARLVDFGGWEMPLHYGSQLEEHRRVRSKAGMFDVSHMLNVDVQGPAARDFLRLLLANDVGRLDATPGKALYSCMLADDGGVLDDLVAYYLRRERYRIVVNAATADGDLRWIEAQLARTGLTPDIRPRRDLAMIAVQGPRARELFWTAQPQARAATEGLGLFEAAELPELICARTGYTGEDGFEVMLPAHRAVDLWQALLRAGVDPCGLGARDTLRLEAGMNLYGQDMDESVTPMESGLAWTVSLGADRDFIGRAALTSRAVRAKLVGLVLRGKGVLRSHQRVRSAHGDGMTTSGSFAPTLGVSIALARVALAVATGDRVEVQIRDQWLPAAVVKYPFVRHGKSLAHLAI